MTAILGIIMGGWKFFTGPIGRWVALAVAVLALLAGVHHHGVTQGRASERVKADREIAAINARLDTCHKSVDDLKATVAGQNAAVDAAKVEGDRMTANAEKAASDARKARNEADKIARRLAAYQSAPTCAAREANINTLVEGLTR